MRRAPALLLSTLMAGALVAGPLAPSPAHAAPDAGPVAAQKVKKVKTKYALATAGFGSVVSGGELPASSDRTAYQAIGCTRLAGITKSNAQVTEAIPGLGVITGAQTISSTSKVGGVISSRSVHTIARVTLVDTPLGRLEIQGLRSESRASRVGGTFRAATSSDVGRIVFTAPGGVATTLPLPTPDRPLEVPGLAKVSVGSTTRATSKVGASATANVLQVQVIPTRTRVVLAQTRAAINGDIQAGIYGGYSAGLVGTGLANNLKLGLTPNNPMPCTGTQGKVKRQDVARVELGDQATVQGVSATNLTTRKGKRATGVVRGQVANVSLAGDRVQIAGVVGQATVSRGRKGLTRSSKGTTIGAITFDGQRQSLDRLGDLEIPGVLKLDQNVTRRLSTGLEVVGLRVTLLDGTGAVIDLGVAKLQVRGVR